MADANVKCPKCGASIPLSESLAAPLVEETRKQFASQLAAKEAELAATLRRERVEIARAEAIKAKQNIAADLDNKVHEVADLQRILSERDVKLAEAQKAQADTMRLRRQLDDEKRELDLTLEKRLQESTASIQTKARREAEEGMKLKLAERDEVITGMQRQIEVLKQRAEQGSQQLQGEVQELELESLLASAFPGDTVTPVPKGEYGGDVVQHVRGPHGQPCGAILWETKRTKNWSDAWLPKLRADQRAVGAEIAMIVSHAMPKQIDTFGLLDGVWVTSPACAIPLATAMRHSLTGIAATRKAHDGQQTKMVLVYEYLTSPRFRHRIEAIVEKASDMHADLDRERKATMRLWAKREEQIRGVIEATAGIYGDLQGIAGKSLAEIDGLAIGLLEENASSHSAGGKA